MVKLGRTYNIAICILVAVILFAAITKPEFVSTDMKELELIVKPSEPKNCINTQQEYQVYLINNHPYKVEISRLPFIRFNRVPAGHQGSMVVAIGLVEGYNETLILNPGSDFFLTNITFRAISTPGIYTTWIACGPLEYERTEQISSCYDRYFVEDYTPTDFNYRKEAIKRGVRASLDKYVYSNRDTPKITLTNQNEFDVITGLLYYLEKYEFETWSVYRPTRPNGDGFVLIGKYVRAGGNYTHEFDISHLEDGFYRINKDVVFGTQDIVEYNLEFKITN